MLQRWWTSRTVRMMGFVGVVLCCMPVYVTATVNSTHTPSCNSSTYTRITEDVQRVHLRTPTKDGQQVVAIFLTGAPRNYDKLAGDNLSNLVPTGAKLMLTLSQPDAVRLAEHVQKVCLVLRWNDHGEVPVPRSHVGDCECLCRDVLCLVRYSHRLSIVSSLTLSSHRTFLLQHQHPLHSPQQQQQHMTSACIR